MKNWCLVIENELQRWGGKKGQINENKIKQ